MTRISTAFCLCLFLGFPGAAPRHAIADPLQQAATSGDMAALQDGIALGRAADQNSLGLSFERGFGVQQNLNAAAMAYRDAAQHGNPDGQYNLGRLYEYGTGVPQDYAAAFEWYQRSAEQGFVLAEVRLGIFYDNGLGVARDYAAAEKWYRKAADQGHVGATDRLLHGPPRQLGLAAKPLQILILAMTAFCLLGTASLTKILAPAVTAGRIRPARAAADIEKQVSPDRFYAEMKHHLFFFGILLVGTLSGIFELALTWFHR